MEWNVKYIAGDRGEKGSKQLYIVWEPSTMALQDARKWQKANPSHVKRVKKISGEKVIIFWNASWEPLESVSKDFADEYFKGKEKKKTFLNLCESEFYGKKLGKIVSSALDGCHGS